MTKKLAEMTYDEIHEKAEEIIGLLVQKASDEGYDRGYENGRNQAKLDAISSKIDVKKLTQNKRQQIVERAKADVAELRYKMSNNDVKFEGNFTCRCRSTTPEFIVNHDKRTVVVLLRGNRSGKIHERGIAKCHPDECFNATLGRAIALRRALGLTVPSEYLNAPQPTEAQVGDVVEWRKFPVEVYEILKRDGSDYDFKRLPSGIVYANMTYRNLSEFTKVIDDSRE